MAAEFGFTAKPHPSHENGIIFSQTGAPPLVLLSHHSSTKFSPPVIKQLLRHFDIEETDFLEAFRRFTKAA